MQFRPYYNAIPSAISPVGVEYMLQVSHCILAVSLPCVSNTIRSKDIFCVGYSGWVHFKSQFDCSIHGICLRIGLMKNLGRGVTIDARRSKMWLAAHYSKVSGWGMKEIMHWAICIGQCVCLHIVVCVKVSFISGKWRCIPCMSTLQYTRMQACLIWGDIHGLVSH